MENEKRDEQVDQVDPQRKQRLQPVLKPSGKKFEKQVSKFGGTQNVEMSDELEPKLRPDSAVVKKTSSKFVKTDGDFSEMSEELDPVLAPFHLK